MKNQLDIRKLHAAGFPGTNIIGAAAGAASGVAVSKNNSKGAIIGGTAGAAGGYLLGRHKDKKKPKTKVVQKTKTVDDK